MAFGFRYLWVAEQHKSGRVHYHAIVGIGYLVKYATKTATSPIPFPKGCRLHGHGGLSSERRVYRSWWMLPKFQRER